MHIRLTASPLALSFIFAGLIFSANAYAQTSIRPSDDVARLDALLKRMTGYMDSLSSFEVAVEQQWRLTGERAAQGKHQLRFLSESGGRFRLTVGSQPSRGTTLQCVGQAGDLTCLLNFEGGSCYSKQSGGIQELMRDPYVYTNLRYSGLDLLLQEDPRAYLLSIASDIKLLDSGQLQERATDHFRLKWAVEDCDIDVWISTDDAPLLQKVAFVHRLPNAGGTPQVIKSEALLTWKRNPQFEESEFKLEIPREAYETLDIYGFMLDGLTRSMLGKAYPQLTLQTLDGQTWSLDQHQAQEVVCLVFWSSTAAPSIPDTERVRELIKRFEAQGVKFYLINAGESVEHIRQFADSREISHPIVLDPNLAAARAFGVTSLPTTLILAKDGTLQSAHVGHTTDILEEIEQDLSQVVAGKTLVSEGE